MRKKTKVLMPEAIRQKCLDCLDDIGEIRFCSTPECPLWVFRFGMYPEKYISQNGEKSSVLFDEKEFREGGRFFSGNQTKSEARKVYKELCSAS